MPTSPRGHAIYLHGLDSAAPGGQERTNRQVLKRLSDKYRVAIAMPRSQSICKTQICWQQADKKEVRASWNYIQNQARKCIGNKPWDLVLGFSNGGYLIGKVLQYCLAPPAKHLVAIGSAGKARAGEAKDVASCGRFHLVVGTKESTYPAARTYRDFLLKRGVKVAFHDYDGGHGLDFGVLDAVMQKAFP